MSISVVIPALIGCLLVGLLIAYTVAPLLRAREMRASLMIGSTDQTLENLLFERESTLAAIRDLQFDRESGKLSDADFEALDQRYRVRAVEILQKLDALGAAEVVSEDEAELDRWIERSVAGARARGAAPLPSHYGEPAVVGRHCTQCGTAARPTDRFCGACGASLALEAATPTA